VTTTRATQAERASRRATPRPIDVAAAIVLAGASGGAIVAHTYLPVAMKYTAPFVVLPGAALLAGVALAWRKRYGAVAILTDRFVAGALWGAVATVVYDVIRPAMVAAFNFDTNPYAAMPVFGSLITGRPADAAIAQTIGWVYHAWNGVSFGVMFALVVPRGGWRQGLAWGLTLEGIMLAVYPGFLGAPVATTAFVVVGVTGHAAWGATLGAGLRRFGRGAGGSRVA